MSLAIYMKPRHPFHSHLCKCYFTAESRCLGRVWLAAGRLVNPKGGGFSAYQEPFGSKHLSVLRKKQAGPASRCFLCINFSPLWYLVAYFFKWMMGNQVRTRASIPGRFIWLQFIWSWVGKGFQVWNSPAQWVLVWFLLIGDAQVGGMIETCSRQARVEWPHWRWGWTWIRLERAWVHWSKDNLI